MSDYTLLTGATGLLGSYLLRDLLIAGCRLVVVARPNKRQSVSERIESLMQMWESQLDQELPRPICLEGDLSKPYLGLEEDSRQWLAEHCSSIIHSAAALTFVEESNGEPWRTNVEGTRHVLELCEDANIREMHYVSTAYICGTRTERIYEEELNLGQSFRNAYEASKLQAEAMVREASYFDNLTVYRPAVIAGDSQTGYTSTYHGLFMYLQLMCVLARNTEPGPDGVRDTSLELHITGDEPRNVIPVDWTSAVISHLFTTPSAHGRTYHLAPRNRMTARQMIEAGYTYFNSRGVKFVGPSIPAERPAGSMGQDAFESSVMYREYEASDPEFDTSNLQKYAGHLPCPDIDEPMLHRFMKYGEEDRWGKRRMPKAHVPFCVGSYLERLEAGQNRVALANGSALEQTLGLDVTGPGGGQWTLTFIDGQLVGLDDGIRSDCSTQLKISSTQFAELAESIDASTPVDDTEEYVGTVAELSQLLGMELVNAGERY
ncbi:MAG: SDR family oxidoreductase [Pirellulales bacterium]|nr:SDR family oxidoreductase [Pirellulales bacterium]